MWCWLQDLERRYQPGAAACVSDAADAAKAAAADLQLVAAFFNQRGWASIEVPKGRGAAALPPELLAELDEQINQVWEGSPGGSDPLCISSQAIQCY